jgi:hypothetical protein
MYDSFDSKILRWAGFVVAGLLVSAFMSVAGPVASRIPPRTPATMSAGLSAPRPAPVTHRTQG